MRAFSPVSGAMELTAEFGYATGFGEIPVTGDTLQLPPGLAAGMAIRAEVAASEPAVIRAIRIGTEVRVRVNGALSSSREGKHRRRGARCFGVESVPCSHASHSGLWMRPVNGLGALARLRRGWSGLRGVWVGRWERRATRHGGGDRAIRERPRGVGITTGSAP
jgi:hypothetical protein